MPKRKRNNRNDPPNSPHELPRTPHDSNLAMAEVRARAARHKGQLNFEQELRTALFAYGDDYDPLPETLRVLDEIVTDFVIETCHTAARSATYSNRQKIKVDDFKFAVRRSDTMLGRVQERAAAAAQMEKARREWMEDELAEGRQGLERGNRLTKEGGAGGEESERPKKRKKVRKGDSTIVMEG